MKVRDGSQNNYTQTRSALNTENASCFELRTVPLITVSGAHSGAGKTSLIEALLGILKGFSALKVTVTHRKGKCPARKECDGCNHLDSGFSIIGDKKTIEARGKDTARFKAAGARKALWLKSKPRALRAGISKALSLFRREKGLIIESNRALKYIEADLAILVKNKDSALKPSAKEILNKIDFIFTL